MIPLRDKTPIRRANPSKNPIGNNWGEHKPELKEDFNSSCGYCDSYDGYRHTYFEVDHFIPKSFFAPLGNITLTQYSNLVYSCKFCNNHKSSKWPVQRENLPHHENNEGFVDPCSDEYATHFYRTNDGGIMWATDLGKWMFREAFKFDERQNSIKILWNLNKLRVTLDALILVLNSYAEGTAEYNEIKARIGGFSFEFYLYHKELIEYYG